MNEKIKCNGHCNRRPKWRDCKHRYNPLCRNFNPYHLEAGGMLDNPDDWKWDEELKQWREFVI